VSISPTFFERNSANILAPIKSLTFTSSTKRLCTKLSYKKAARKMLVKLTPVVLFMAKRHHERIKGSCFFGPKQLTQMKPIDDVGQGLFIGLHIPVTSLVFDTVLL
jgi:hypothetical protein